MDTPETPGQVMHSDDTEQRREAARMMGRARTERKVAAARAVAESRRGVPLSEETRAKLREAQKERRERERAERMASGEAPAEKRAPGRPRTRPLPDPDAPKRPVGRPKKDAGEPA